jgi:hypothetical protein
MNNNNMHMVHAPPKTSIMDRPLETRQQHHQQRNASPANAYLQHLQSKKSSGKSNNYGIDPRQTIASPTLRNKVSSVQQVSQISSTVASSISSRTTPNNNNWMPTNPNNNKAVAPTADAKRLPRSSPTNSTGTPQSGGKQRRGSRGSPRKDKQHKSKSAKPPLCNQKFPRSVISEATNSTYLSSESDEDASTATATVHSDGTSSFQSGHSATGGIRRRKSRSIHDESSSRSNGSSPRNYPSENHRHSNALVPYQPNDQFDEDAYTTDNNSTNFYFNTENHQQRHHHQFYDNHNTERNNNMFHDDADAFSYSDEDEYYFHQQRVNHQQLENYTDEEDTETLAVDLDQLIEEASARWKLTVSETVQNTATATSFASQQQIGLSPTTTTPVIISPLLRRQYMDAMAFGVVAPSTSGPDFVMNDNNALLVNQNLTYPDIVATTSSSSSQLIHEQQSEIEALRAELQKQQQQFQSAPAPSSNPPFDVAPQQQHQIHPIQVLTVATDHHNVDDDLTVWSGFQSMTPPPPIQHRPDADGNSSIVDGNNYSRPFSTPVLIGNKSTTTRVPQPPRPPQTIRLELSSIVTGITRTAIFTGTITSKSVPTTDSFTTLANHSITGTGVLQFIETGDVYRGDIVHSEMHGYGTYTFGGSNDKQQHSTQVLRGRFEHNVFIGE